MKILLAVVLICFFHAGRTLAEDSPVEPSIQAVFSELRSLKMMHEGQDYTVRVGGTEETGVKEKFLRRRTAGEISESGLSCGCGDYAILFIDRIESKGFQALLVDGAEISLISLRDHFSGHAVVAIRHKDAPANGPWWLVDSTNLKVISQAWSRDEKSFQAFGEIFWIGYCGPLADYPVHNAESLQAFYARTLAGIPRDFLNHALVRLKFTVDASLIGKDGSYLNPRLADFLRLQSTILTDAGAEPVREVNIRLTRGEDGVHTDLNFSEPEGWVSHLGLQSGCSPSLLAYYEQSIRRREQQKSKAP